MDLGSILKKVGGSIISSVVPGGSLILDLVNGFLPKERKLGKSATGTDIEDAIKTLPPEQQQELLSKKLDVKMTEIKEWSNVMSTLAQADASGASTRPKIALMMAWVVTIVIIAVVLVWTISILTNQTETLKQLSTSWAMMLSILTPPIALLRAYFGMRTKEKQTRYSGAFGLPLKGGIVSEIINAIRR